MITPLLVSLAAALTAATPTPDVEVLLSQALVEKAVETALTRALEQAKAGMAVSVVSGTPPVRFTPEAALESLSITKRPGCACLDVVASVMGRLVPDVGVPGIQLAPPRFHVDFTAPLEVAVAGDAVVGRARKGERMSAVAEVLDLPPDAAATATRLMQDELTKSLAGAGDRSITLLALGDAPAPVSGVDVRVIDKGLALDLDLDLPKLAAAVAPAGGTAAAAPSWSPSTRAPAQGFSIVVPLQTLRGLVQKAAANAAPTGSASPLRGSGATTSWGPPDVQGAMVDATGRVVVDALWKERGDAPSPGKRVQLAGRLVVDAAGRPVFTADSSTLALDAGAALVRKDLAAALDATLRFLVPAGDRNVGGRTVRVRATSARGVANALIVDGTFDPR